jgi:hypothetical protein
LRQLKNPRVHCESKPASKAMRANLAAIAEISPWSGTARA